jgi:hypothetical protein
MIGRKYPISHRFRVFTLLLVMLAAAASTVLLIAFGLIGVTVEAPETKAVYSSVSEILCDLDMAYDPLYNENALEFGDGYAARFVDAAVLSFLYRFDCTDAFDFGGSYSVSAVLEAGYDTSLIWKKQYLLIPESPLTGDRSAKASACR